VQLVAGRRRGGVWPGGWHERRRHQGEKEQGCEAAWPHGYPLVSPHPPRRCPGMQASTTPRRVHLSNAP
jgi:hypothetical protein